MKKSFKIFSAAILILAAFFACFLVWDNLKSVPTASDWRDELAIQSTAEINGNIAIVKNVRNFRYSQDEEHNTIGYYDQQYDLSKISKVWYIFEPFNTNFLAAHTFLSFEFSDGKFITITIEARKKKGQDYSVFWGMFRTYPLIYIAADERDSIMVRTNIRKSKVYLYPAKATPEQAKMLFADMLEEMNNLVKNPSWYNTFTANCTSSIAYHINKLWPKRLPKFMWQEWVTGYADQGVFKQGLIDTNLSLSEARKKYYITNIAQNIGDSSGFSQEIRKFSE